eukprot:g22466.t1
MKEEIARRKAEERAQRMAEALRLEEERQKREEEQRLEEEECQRKVAEAEREETDRLQKQSFEHRSWEIMLRSYRTLVRPLLEYCVQFWSPYYLKDIIKLERVQKRFIRMLLGMEGLSYKERLDRLELFSLEH